MNRRKFIQSIGAASLIGVAGCVGGSGSEAPHGTVEENAEVDYNYKTENFTINSLYISRNAPDKVGISVDVVSNQFEGASVPLELWVVDADGNTVFHEKEFIVGLDGGSAETGTAWFTATEEEFHMDLYPKARFRTEPPK